MSYVEVKLSEMEALLTADKGWIRNVSGYEYVFDFHLAKYPIIVKVLSSVNAAHGRARNKGSDAIRVFAVQKAGMEVNAKVMSGVTKAIRINRVPGWQDRVKAAVILTMANAKRNYDRYRR